MRAGTLPEIPAFCAAVYGGLIVGAVYDLFRFLRLPFHSRHIIACIDFLYYVAAAAIAAATLMYINGGTVRLYIFLGMGLGIYAYIRFPGRLAKATALKIQKKQLHK